MHVDTTLTPAGFGYYDVWGQEAGDSFYDSMRRAQEDMRNGRILMHKEVFGQEMQKED